MWFFKIIVFILLNFVVIFYLNNVKKDERVNWGKKIKKWIIVNL